MMAWSVSVSACTVNERGVVAYRGRTPPTATSPDGSTSSEQPHETQTNMDDDFPVGLCPSGMTLPHRGQRISGRAGADETGSGAAGAAGGIVRSAQASELRFANVGASRRPNTRE